MNRSALVAVLGLLLIAAPAPADGPPAGKGAYKSVADLKAAHDRTLVRDLLDYLQANPRADDRDAAYLALFDTVIEHDWFLDHEATAKRYLAENPNGAVRSLALIVATMARTQAGRYREAWSIYKDLIAGLEKGEQEEFAANFADTLAGACASAGEYEVARKVYETLLDRFGDRDELRAKVKDDLARIDRVGKPAPTVAVLDTTGKPFRLSDLKGKYVLVDFWATWCAPCLAELPTLQAAYARYHAKGFEIVSISLDETIDPLNDFLKARKLPWRQIHNATCRGDAVDAFGVNNIPASFLIGPDGTVLRLECRGSALEKALSKLIK
jgi:thiol-disulfide isomerase/thioredoxin